MKGDSPQTQKSPALRLQGVVEHSIYRSPNGWGVVRLLVEGRGAVTAVGIGEMELGQSLELWGNWQNHPKYGTQFHVERYRLLEPDTLIGIEKYLASGSIEGISPAIARRLVSHFGLDTLNIIKSQTARLAEVPGIGSQKLQKIQQAIERQPNPERAIIARLSRSVSPDHALKIYQQYKQQSIEVMSRNPYQLAVDISGIGFPTADKIALNLGIAPDAEFRYRSGIRDILMRAEERGHCFLPESELIQLSIQSLSLPEHRPNAEAVLSAIQKMVSAGDLVRAEADLTPDEPVYYAPTIYSAERNLSIRIEQLLARPLEVDLPRVRRWLNEFGRRVGVELSAEQRQGVELAAGARVAVLTGGPGTGKSFSLRTVAALWQAMGKEVALTSPTGRAAKRLSEVTGMPATTVHRLLELDPKTIQFHRNGNCPLSAEAVIVDEASMLDLLLANSLLDAISPNAQLLLVGDSDQLLGIGCGKVFEDLIASGRIPTARLTRTFRQAESSAIIRAAGSIVKGRVPALESISPAPQSDCLWWEIPEPERGAAAIVELAGRLIPKLGFSTSQVQVLCPMHRSDVGTRHLNSVLQELINPPAPHKAEIRRGGVTLREGDRIIQQVNDCDKEVFNGDLGVIQAIYLEREVLQAVFDGGLVSYEIADLSSITLAYSLSIHKSQGSEYPVVILPLYMQHYPMLSRNLLYTALTRAKQLAILVGSSQAMAVAVRQGKEQRRYTLLSERLESLGHIEKRDFAP